MNHEGNMVTYDTNLPLAPCTRCPTLGSDLYLITWHNGTTYLSHVRCPKCGKRTTSHHSMAGAMDEWQSIYDKVQAAKAAKHHEVIGEG